MTNTFKIIAACLLSVLAVTSSCQDEYEPSTPTYMSGGSTHRLLTGSEARQKKDFLMTHLKAGGAAGLQKLRQTFASSATSRLTLRDLEPLIDYEESTKYGASAKPKENILSGFPTPTPVRQNFII